MRTIVVTEEQGKALKTMKDNSRRFNQDPHQAREYLVKVALDGHTTWEDTYISLNAIPLSDLLYIVTGGTWEVQKTVKGVLEDLRDKYREDGIQGAVIGINVALEKLQREGLIK